MDNNENKNIPHEEPQNKQNSLMPDYSYNNPYQPPKKDEDRHVWLKIVLISLLAIIGLPLLLLGACVFLITGGFGLIY